MRNNKTKWWLFLSCPTPTVLFLSLSLNLISFPVNADGVTDLDSSIASVIGVRKLSGSVFPVGFEKKAKDEKAEIKCFGTEHDLLSFVANSIQRVDPDILVGHNLLGYDLDILLHRMQATNLRSYSKLGRLKLSQKLKLSNKWEQKRVISGRLICDTYLSAKELVRSKNFKLDTLSRKYLGVARRDIERDRIPEAFRNTNSLLHLCNHCANDAYLSFSLCLKLNIIPLSKQLTQLCGNLWSKSLSGARAERIEYLLLHKFHSLGYLLPDKMKSQGIRFLYLFLLFFFFFCAGWGKKRGKPKYAGGLVLSPKSDLYDKYVLLLDFNSLYPSIIQEFNICFTTVQREKVKTLQTNLTDHLIEFRTQMGNGFLLLLLQNQWRKVSSPVLSVHLSMRDMR